MLDWILKLIIKLIFFIIGLIFNIILSIFDIAGLDNLQAPIDDFFALFEGVINFTAFIVGPTFSTFATLIATLFTLKHIIIPVVIFVRKFFMK